MARLSVEDRGRDIGLLQGHNAIAPVAWILWCAKATAVRLWTKFRRTGKLILQMPTPVKMQNFGAICPVSSDFPETAKVEISTPSCL